MTNPLASLLQADAQSAGIDPRWALATAQTESALNPTARSPVGATGVMQLMPQTAQGLGVNPNNVFQNIQGGIDLLAQNLHRYGNPAAASAAYFGGTDPQKWGPKTRQYVQKIEANYAKDKQMNGPSPLQQLLANAQKAAAAPAQDTAAPPASASGPSPLQTLLANAQNAVKTRQPKEPGLGQDFVSGVVKGVEGIGSLGNSPEMNALQNSLGVKPVAIPPAVQAIKAQANNTNPTGLLGTAAQGAGEFMPGLLMGGDGGIAGLARQGVGLAASGAGSAVGQKVAGPIGGLVGAFAPGGAELLGAKAVDAVAGPRLSPERAELARNYQALGGKLGGTEVTGSPFMKYLDSTAKHVPLMGSSAHDEAIQSAFNRAVSAQMGTPAEKITPKVMAQTKERLGATFDDLAHKIPIKADDQLIGDLGQIQSDASAEVPDSTMKPINKQLNDVLDSIGEDGTISGKQYQALTRKGTPLARAMDAPDPNVRYFAGQIRDALDNAMERSAPPDLLGKLRQARYQYKVMKTIQPLVEKSDAGDISPALLRSQVARSFGNMAYDGAGAMGTLARAGQAFLKEPPNSGTAPRMEALGLLTGGLGGATALELADPHMLASHGISAGGALAGIAGTRAFLSAARSEPAANWLLRRAENPPTPTMTPILQQRLLAESVKNPTQ